MTEGLPNHPLREAIFEMHWVNSDEPMEIGTLPVRITQGQLSVNEKIVDRFHKIFLGRAFDRISETYPFPKELPASKIPESMSGHIVQHQFWHEEHEWPVVQIGPGILTVNDGPNYDWNDFYHRIEHMVDLFPAIHPKPDAIRTERVILRYNNFIEFDFVNDNILDFLREKMHTSISGPSSISDISGLSQRPAAFNLRYSFSADAPKGILTSGITTASTLAENGNRTGLMWELQFVSSGSDAPGRAEMATWAKDSHNVIDSYFNCMIAGELERGFRGE